MRFIYKQKLRQINRRLNWYTNIIQQLEERIQSLTKLKTNIEEQFAIFIGSDISETVYSPGTFTDQRDRTIELLQNYTAQHTHWSNLKHNLQRERVSYELALFI